MSLSAPLWRDSNHTPVQTGGVVSRKSQTLSGSNATVATSLFRVTGAIEVVKLCGEVTTDLGSNNTAAYYRLNDQTAQVDITLSTGTTLSSAKAGSVIVKKGLAGAAVTLINNSAGRINEPTTLETSFFSPFSFVQKTAANTDIEFVYSTTQTPTTGVIQHFVVWLPISSDASVTAQ